MASDFFDHACDAHRDTQARTHRDKILQIFKKMLSKKKILKENEFKMVGL